MQQLLIPFEEFGWNSQPVNASTAKQCTVNLENSLTGNKTFPSLGISRRCLKACELSVGWALRQVNPSAALSRVVARVKLFSQAAAAVTFAFGIMFFAALIGG